MLASDQSLPWRPVMMWSREHHCVLMVFYNRIDKGVVTGVTEKV